LAILDLAELNLHIRPCAQHSFDTVGDRKDMQTVKNLLSLYPEVLSNKIPLIISKLFSLATPAAWGLRPFWRPPLLSPAYVTVTWNTSVEKKLLMMTMMMVKVAVI